MSSHYLIISMAIALLTLVPCVISFERKNFSTGHLVIAAVMIATAVVGRAAFFMIPNFKPILAIVIIAGVALGGETGFMVGAMSAFVSNFLFGQGPWTPFQMVAMGLAGLLAGLIFHRLHHGDGSGGNIVSTGTGSVMPLAIFGAVYVFFIYGGIVDIWTIFSITPEPTLATVIGVYSAAIVFNVVHAGATFIFIMLLAKPMLKKINRVKIKYGI